MRRLRRPADAFEFTFSAPADTPYHVWLRLHASANSKFNDSVFAQFSDAVDPHGAALYPIGTTSGLFVNLQSCNGCALSGWGWIDGAYWLTQQTTVSFRQSGTHTLRIQTREDGVQLDEIVLSPSTYLVAIARAGDERSDEDHEAAQPAEVRRPSPGPRSQFPVRSRHRTSTTAAKAWPTTIRRAATPAARTGRRTSISKRARTAATMSDGWPPASG